MKETALLTTKEIMNGIGEAMKYIETKATPLFKTFYEGLLKKAIINGYFQLIGGISLFLLCSFLLIFSFKKTDEENDMSGLALGSIVLIIFSVFLIYYGIGNIICPEVKVIEHILFMIKQ